jgi:molybdopterin molybdotransferase
MISFDEALEYVRAAGHPFGTEIIAIDAASSRVLAAPVTAQISSPRCNVSAMDGYAARESDLGALPARLRVIGESFAGAGWTGTLGVGECIRIFTGAPVPSEADRVVIQEVVRREDDIAIIDEPLGTSRHIRARGSDFQAGDQLLPAGRLLDKRAIVAAAGADLATVEVFTRPRTAILSTGDELAAPGTASARIHAIPESVSLGVAALVEEWGAIVSSRQRLPDDLAAMEHAAARAVADSDLVVVTGGASVGEKDFAKRMFEPVRLELLFSKVSIKPGKPVWLGRAGKTLVMGLPGNPSSALVTARLLLAPLIAGLSGRDPQETLRWRKAALATGLAASGPRETFHRARLSGEEVELLGFQDSSAQKALADADVLVRQPAGHQEISEGAKVDTLEF